MSILRWLTHLQHRQAGAPKQYWVMTWKITAWREDSQNHYQKGYEKTSEIVQPGVMAYFYQAGTTGSQDGLPSSGRRHHPDRPGESLRMMLGNLIDNAVRYTPGGGRVDVELRAHAGMARLSVSDSGPEHSADRARAGVRALQRLAGADIPGSGLGLSSSDRWWTCMVAQSPWIRRPAASPGRGRITADVTWRKLAVTSRH